MVLPMWVLMRLDDTSEVIVVVRVRIEVKFDPAQTCSIQCAQSSTPLDVLHET